MFNISRIIKPYGLLCFRNDTMQKKVTIIVIILCLCVVCAIILSFVNIHDDYVEMSNFYRGYMGRRLLIQEKRLVYWGQVERVKIIQVEYILFSMLHFQGSILARMPRELDSLSFYYDLNDLIYLTLNSLNCRLHFKFEFEIF